MTNAGSPAAPAAAPVAKAATRMTLAEAHDALRIVDAMLEEHAEALAEAGGDLAAVPGLMEVLDLAEGDFKRKAEAVAIYCRDLEARADHAAAEAKRLTARAKTLGMRADGLKEHYLKRHMLAAGLTKIEGDLMDVRVQESGTPKFEVLHAPGTADLEPFGAFVAVVPEHTVTIPESREWIREAIVGAVKAHRAAEKAEEKLAAKEKRAPRPIEPPALPPGVRVTFTSSVRFN